MQAKVAALALILTAGAAWAEVPVTETAVNGKAAVTLHPHDFLTDEELAVLRLVLTNADALTLFVPEGDGFAAMAVSPDDGFIRDAVPVKSAVALAGLPDAATAATEAMAGCDKVRMGKGPCVIVLEVAPAP